MTFRALFTDMVRYVHTLDMSAQVLEGRCITGMPL